MTRNRYKKPVKKINGFIKRMNKLKNEIRILDLQIEKANDLHDVSRSSVESNTLEIDADSAYSPVVGSKKHLMARLPVTRRKTHRFRIVNKSRRKRNYQKEYEAYRRLFQLKVRRIRKVEELEKRLYEKMNINMNTSWTSELDITQDITDESEDESPQTQTTYSPMPDSQQIEDNEQDYCQTPVTDSKTLDSKELHVKRFTVTGRHSPPRKMILGAVRRSTRLASLKAKEAIRVLYVLVWKMTPRRPRRERNLKKEHEEGEESSDWREGEFNWIKFYERSKPIPGIVFSNNEGIRLARSITLKGTLSIHTFCLIEAYKQIKDSLKDIRYKRAVKVFNSRNDCYFE